MIRGYKGRHGRCFSCPQLLEHGAASPDGSAAALGLLRTPIPDGPCPVCPRHVQEFEPWRQASYRKAMHDHARRREQQLHRRVAERQAQLRLREQQLFGRKTERG